MIYLIATYQDRENYAAHNEDWDGKESYWKFKGGTDRVLCQFKSANLGLNPEELDTMARQLGEAHNEFNPAFETYMLDWRLVDENDIALYPMGQNLQVVPEWNEDSDNWSYSGSLLTDEGTKWYFTRK